MSEQLTLKELSAEVVKSVCGETINNDNANIASVVGTAISHAFVLGYLNPDILTINQNQGDE